MKTLKGKIINGEILPLSRLLTIETFEPDAQITLGQQVTVTTLNDSDIQYLQSLRLYLADQPAITNEKEIKDGLYALWKILGPMPIENDNNANSTAN